MAGKGNRTESLFKGDKAWEEQEKKAAEMEKVADVLKFLGYKPLVASCSNCTHRVDGCCMVMYRYNGVKFECGALGKCKHYKAFQGDENA